MRPPRASETAVWLGVAPMSGTVARSVNAVAVTG
jgi:hypothetical protein